MGPIFSPPSLETITLSRLSISHYYTKPLLVLDPQLYAAKQFPYGRLCPGHNHSNENSISTPYSSWTELQTCIDTNRTIDVIGHVYKCSLCKTIGGAAKTFRTTSDEFWQSFKLKDRPRWAPIIFARSMFSNEFAQYVRVHRLSSTFSGLAANITQKHVKNYLDYKYGYYTTLGTTTTSSDHIFSGINIKTKWDGIDRISDDHIKSVWDFLVDNYLLQDFSTYMRTLYSDDIKTLAWDSQHSLAKKAKTVIGLNKRVSIMKSISAIVDSNNYVASICMTLTHSNEEIKQQMQGLARRYDMSTMKRELPGGAILSGSDLIERVGTDYVEKYHPMVNSVFPNAKAFQDSFHWMQLLADAIFEGTKNPSNAAVRGRIAQVYKAAKDKEELNNSMEDLFSYFSASGTVWNAAARDIFDKQLDRVKKGYLDKGDVTADTSRVENVFKHLNRIQNSFSCNLETFVGLLLCSVDQLNRNNAMRLRDPFALAVHGYQDIVWANNIQQLEKACFAGHHVHTMRDPIESGEEFGICRIRPSEDMNAAETLLDRNDREDEIVDYEALNRINTWAAEQRVLELGIQPNRLNQLIEQMAATQIATPPATPVNSSNTAVSATPSTEYLRRRVAINADLFSLEGDEHFTFMNLRKLHRWTNTKTNWLDAEKIWEMTKRIVNRRRPEFLGFYSTRAAVVLQRKCIDIEINMPRYLQKWNLLKANGTEIHIQDGEEINVQKKIDYWQAQQLDAPPVRYFKCTRCRLDKHSIDVLFEGQTWKISHPEKVCSDEVPIRFTNIPFRQPEGLFLGPEGLLDIDKCNQLMEQCLNTATTDDPILSNFSIFALSIMGEDGRISYQKLALLGINKRNVDSDNLRNVWLTGRANKRKRLQ
jgi:hypothetical protein